MPYLLADGIYPDWPIFIKPKKDPTDVAERRFSSNQEAARKDIERFFGVLKGRFQILRRELKVWELDDIILISKTCVILHNLIVRMQQNGDFRDEAAGANLITEFLGTDETSATIAATEYETNCQRIEDEVRDEWEQQVVRWTVNDRQYMDYNTFVCLETELINYHTATGHDVGLPVS